MNKMIKSILLLACVGAIAFLISFYDKNRQKAETAPTPSPQAESSPTPQSSGDFSITSPQENEVITSPVTVAGKVPGSWFFEAQLTVKLLDGDGKQIATGTGTAKEDWMTEKPVPFEATLTFEKPSTLNGMIVIEKDNPSGLPQNAQSLEFPVRF
jgi:cytoskeletal protein RodZ